MKNATTNNSLETLAVAKAIKATAEKVARGEIGVGVHNVDTWVRVSGTLTVGEDYEQRIVAKAEPWRLLEVALSKLNGVTVAAIVAEALEGSIDGEVIKALADDAMATIKGQTVTACKGKVTTNLVVEFASAAEKAVA